MHSNPELNPQENNYVMLMTPKFTINQLFGVLGGTVDRKPIPNPNPNPNPVTDRQLGRPGLCPLICNMSCTAQSVKYLSNNTENTLCLSHH